MFPGLTNVNLQRRLRKDEIGICVFPTIQAPCVSGESKPESKRAERKRKKDALENPDIFVQKNVVDPEPKRRRSKEPGASSSYLSPSAEKRPQAAEPVHESEPPDMCDAEGIPAAEEIGEGAGANQACASCVVLRNEKRKLSNTVKSLRKKLIEKRKEFAKMEKKLEEMQSHDLEVFNKVDFVEESGADFGDAVAEESDTEEAQEGTDDSTYETEEEPTTETESEDDGHLNTSQYKRVSVKGTNLRTEPKHIVFLSQLLLLFGFCHSCKTDNPMVDVDQVGTEAVVTSTCSNPKCPNPKSTWHSQPTMPGTKLPAGNFLLCMAILVAGASASKVFTVFAHMGLGCISLNTFFKYQRIKLFPTILLYWEKYQKQMLEKVKAVKDGIIIAGDGRHDSMGHCAKYGAYTIFCCTIPMILHFSLIQRNQAGSSPAMEFMGFKSCMEFLIGYGLLITAFVSDRHVSIAAYMRKSLTAITHYFDIWHLKKKIRKVLSKLCKEKGCECIAEWIKPCENHLYWSATTTFSGNGQVIWAKFRSFMSHIINKHSGLTDPLFNKCFHGVIQPRKWLKAGSQAYEKLCSVLNNINLVKGIKQASPFAQTSCLEGFHSVLNHFAPKMIAFSYVGMYCRHILAAVHFNFNLHRDVKRRNSDNAGQLKFTYPKFKNGEATVRDVKISQNFDYVEEIFQTFLSASSDDLKGAVGKLKELTPLPMNSMLERESRTDAVKKKTDRSKKVVEDVPPTTPVDQVQEQAPRNTQAAAKKKKAPPKCSLCGHPTKGHNKVTTCPKNQRKK